MRLSSVIYRENQWEIVDLALSLGASSFAFSFVEDVGCGTEFNENHMINVTEEYSSFVMDAITKYCDYMPIIRKRDLREDRANCGAGTGRILIGADGNVRPCLMLGETEWFGNVIHQPLQDILASPKTLDWLKLPEPTEEHGCPSDCEHVHECNRCIARRFSKGTSLVEGEYHYCDPHIG